MKSDQYVSLTIPSITQLVAIPLHSAMNPQVDRANVNIIAEASTLAMDPHV